MAFVAGKVPPHAQVFIECGRTRPRAGRRRTGSASASHSPAELAAGTGANVAPGLTVVVSAQLGQEASLGRWAACYDRGARHVQVDNEDPYVNRVRLEWAPEAALGR